MLELKNKKLEVHGSEKNVFTSTFIISPKNKIERRGTSYITIQINEDKNLSKKISEIIKDIFETEYYKEPENPAGASRISIGPLFEGAIHKTNKALQAIASEGYVKWTNNLHVSIAVIKNTEIHLAYTGNAKTYLFRDEKLIELSQDNGKTNSDKIFSQTVSGVVKKNDIIIATTPELLDYISAEKLKRSLKLKGVEGTTEEFSEILNESNNIAPISSIFINVAPPFTSNYNAQAEKPKNVDEIEKSQTTKSPQTQKGKEPLPTFFEETQNTESEQQQTKNELAQKTLSAIKTGGTKTVSAIKGIFKIPSEKEIQQASMPKPPEPGRPISSDSYLEPTTKPQKNLIEKAKELINNTVPAEHKSKFYAALAIIAAIILIVIIGRSISARNQSEQLQAGQTALANAIETEKKASDALIYRNYNEAEQYIDQVQNIIQNDLSEEQKSSLEYKDLERKLKNNLDKINKINRVTPTAVTTNSQNLKHLAGNNDALFSTGEKPQVFQLNSNNQLVEISQTEDGISNIIHAEFNDQKNIIAFATEKTLAEMPLFSKKISNSTENAAFATAKDMTIYADKIYTLDTEENQIQRFTRTVDGYNDGEGWIDDGTDISNGTSIAIDANVYVLNKNGTITKFNRGQKETFSVQKLGDQLSENTKLITSENHTYLYILDKEHKTLVLYSKSGQLVEQLALELDDTLLDFFINTESNTAFILGQNNLYELKLK